MVMRPAGIVGGRGAWGAAVAAVVVSGCAHSVSGAAVRDSRQAITPLRAGDTDQVLVAPAQVHDVVGARMQVDADQTRPVFGSSALAACSAFESVGTTRFVGKDWSRIRVLLFTDGDRHDQVVAEAVAVYPDAGAASDAFSAGARDAKACDGQRALSAGSAEAWAFTVPEPNVDTVRWTKQQLGIPLTWVCHGEARLRNNALLQAMACGGGDGGATVVTSLTDRMSASVWELSGQ